jgi:hypothetical protein
MNTLFYDSLLGPVTINMTGYYSISGQVVELLSTGYEVGGFSLCSLIPTNTPTQTSTVTPTNTETPTNTPTNTETPTNTPTNTETPTVTPTNTKTPTVTPTNTKTPTVTPTNTETPTNTPTNTETPTNTPTNTETPTVTPTVSPTPPSVPYIYGISFPVANFTTLYICIDINNDGGSPITQCGVVYNTTGNPTTANNIIPYSNIIGLQCQTFTRPIPGQPYYFAVFATNSVGTSYLNYGVSGGPI